MLATLLAVLISLYGNACSGVGTGLSQFTHANSGASGNPIQSPGVGGGPVGGGPVG